jgi:translation initiation factor 1
MSKKKPNPGGIVYSTDPDFRMDEDVPQEETPAPRAQKLRIKLDTKQRAGKAVTIVEGFMGRTEDLEELGKKLKGHCGTGGSVKDGLILVQGDQRDKILQWLLKNQYSASKKAG